MQIANFAHLDGVAEPQRKKASFYVKILPINVSIINPTIQVVEV
jgi:hypothetical protein